MEALWAGVRDDDLRSVRFFERADFGLLHRSWMSRLSVEVATPERFGVGRMGLVSGVTFTTLAEEGAGRRDVQERIYRRYLEASWNAPRTEKTTGMNSSDAWSRCFAIPDTIPKGLPCAGWGRVRRDEQAPSLAAGARYAHARVHPHASRPPRTWPCQGARAEGGGDRSASWLSVLTNLQRFR